LPEFAARVHQRGRIGQELQLGHHPVEVFRERLRVRFFDKQLVSGGNRLGHAPQHVDRRFEDFALLVALQVAPLQDSEGVGRQLRHKGGMGLFFH
jgi:hypothetical protein